MLLVSRWDRTRRRYAEKIRDKIMDPIGTKEALIEENLNYVCTWRKPLSIVEVNQMAPTAEVRERKGRP